MDPATLGLALGGNSLAEGRSDALEQVVHQAASQEHPAWRGGRGGGVRWVREEAR